MRFSIVGYCLIAIIISIDATPKKNRITIGTGGTAGVYYPLGGAIAEIITKSVHSIDATAASTGGSVVNITGLASDEYQLIIAQNDVAYYAQNGIELFQGNKYTDIRGIATLYDETIQIVTPFSSGITTLSEGRGKKIAVGAEGSGAEINARQILGAAGLTYKDFDVRYLSFAEAATELKDGTIDIAFITAGLPTAAVKEVAAYREIRILPIPEKTIATLLKKYPFYTRSSIPQETYSQQQAAISTVAVKAMLVVNASMPKKTVYKMTKSIFSNLPKLGLAHIQGKAIKKEAALEGMSIQLHPGARRYFRKLQ
ncbi:MAG: TAXI family TRAP transporter solute-binding subunit [Chitinivibrionales bacterium]|nr:TAXI family TRAP transporter solute-binding subunit [Chitinivibrionales bacterium]